MVIIQNNSLSSVQNLHLRVLLPEFLAQRTADILPGLALLLTVFNELVRLKQCRGADLAAEKTDTLIPCQQLEHIVQRGALHTVDIHKKQRKSSLNYQEN